MLTFDYIAGGKLYTYTDGRSLEVSSGVLDSYRRKVRDSAARNEWKHTGEGAAFRGAYTPGADPESRVAAVSSRAVCVGAHGGDRIYSLVIDRSCGIYRQKPDDENEGIVISSSDCAYLDFDIRGERMVLTSAFAGESHIGVLEIGSTACKMYTEGHTWDSRPVWSACEKDTVYFCCAGLPIADSQEEEPSRPMGYSEMVTRMLQAPQSASGRGPSAICRLDLARQSMEEVLADDGYDYLAPQSTKDGSLFYIRRPYQQEPGGSNPFGCLKDLFLIPVRLLAALFGFLNVFSAKYSGKTLSGSAAARRKDEKTVFVEGNLIRAEEELRANRQSGDKNPGIIPRTWELRRRKADGSDLLIARGVSAFRAMEDGTVLVSNGSAILCLDRNGEEKLCSAENVTFIR